MLLCHPSVYNILGGDYNNSNVNLRDNMKDTVSVTTLETEVASTLEIFEKNPLSWENGLFFRLNKSKFGLHSYCFYLKDKTPYQEELISEKQVGDFLFLFKKALNSTGISTVKLGSFVISVASFPDGRCGISIEGIKWMVEEDTKQILIDFLNTH